jgi:hypothetical protein
MTTPERPEPDPPGAVRTVRARRLTIGLLVGVGLFVALLLAFFVSPLASSSPDGLAKVAADKAIDNDERDHALAEGPLADYSVRGVHDERLSTGLAGITGVVVTFTVGGGLFVVLRRTTGRRGRGVPPVAAAATGATGGGP